MDFIYLEQHPYIKVSWAYIKSAYNYHIIYKPSKLNLFILVDFAVSSRSL
jgi:hypothetical protein